MALTRTLIHEWIKTRPAQAGHNSEVYTMLEKIHAAAALALMFIALILFNFI